MCRPKVIVIITINFRNTEKNKENQWHFRIIHITTLKTFQKQGLGSLGFNTESVPSVQELKGELPHHERCLHADAPWVTDLSSTGSLSLGLTFSSVCEAKKILNDWIMVRTIVKQ